MITIRTQDRKRLLKCNDIELIQVDPNGTYKICENRTIIDWENVNREDWIDLGTYATEERALEVLDEIQEAINGRLLIAERTRSDLENDISHLYVQPSEKLIRQIFSVYEMPKE